MKYENGKLVKHGDSIIASANGEKLTGIFIDSKIDKSVKESRVEFKNKLYIDVKEVPIYRSQFGWKFRKK